MQQLYTRFLPLIVFEQQPGVAIRKEILRLRGAIDGNRVRHPGATIQPVWRRSCAPLIEQVLPGVDITQAADALTPLRRYKAYDPNDRKDAEETPRPQQRISGPPHRKPTRVRRPLRTLCAFAVRLPFERAEACFQSWPA